MKRKLCTYAFVALTTASVPCSSHASDADLKIASQRSGLDFVKLNTLPRSPKDNGDRNLCSNHIVKAGTPGGLQVEKQGWAVTSEVPLGPYEAVSFAGTFEAGTSGTCQILDGNVGIFLSDRLVALIYAARKSNLSIGAIIPFGGKGVRIVDGDLLQSTVADIRTVGETGLIVTPPALEEKVCDGVSAVPYIEALPIDIARSMLAERGWIAVDQSGAGTRSSGEAEEIAKRGIVEVQDCSGTGFGFCGYIYKGAAGDLFVTTFGEVAADGSMPHVAGYRIDCAAPK